VKTNSEKTELIRNWGVPSTSANFIFLLLVEYYRQFIKNFAAREAPLRAALRRAVSFKTGP
jgi:hypothetical protein